MTPEMKKTWKYTAAVFHSKSNEAAMKIMEKAAKEAKLAPVDTKMLQNMNMPPSCPKGTLCY